MYWASVNFLPNAPENWIVSEVENSEKCDSWITPAALKLLSMLSGDLQVEGQIFSFTFKGDRIKFLDIDLSLPKDVLAAKSVYRKVNETVKWVYAEEKHIATKLTFLHQGLIFGLFDDVRHYQSDDLRRIFSNAFDSAQLSFEYFLKNISKEVVKNMGDLTKALLDNQAKIKQNISDLSSTMWKDFTTVFGVLALQFAVKQNDLVAKYFPFFGYGMCIYVVISYGITS
jgi:hypothetical protein